jgi:hypothetical protein
MESSKDAPSLRNPSGFAIQFGRRTIVRLR